VLKEVFLGVYLTCTFKTYRYDPLILWDGTFKLQSPKFAFVKKQLDDTFTRSILKEEWKKRVKYQIRKQIIFDPIEYRDYDEDLDNIIDGIRLDITSGTYQVKPAKRFLVEKSVGLCRQMTLIHPRDLLVLERLSRSFYFELKSNSPSKSAFFEPDDGSFVKGFQQSDFQYGSYASWKRFQKKVFGFASENKYLVITDVANFYDFINFQHLRNIISSLSSVRECVLDLLIYLLNRLTWTPDFMPLTQIGMPQIETTATRVLANAMLYEVDKVCEDYAKLNYARFMDDMDIGVESTAQAKKIVRDIDLTLQSRQLRLNSSKTKILSQMEAFDHFRISENIQLSTLESASTKAKWATKIGPVLLSKYTRWLDRTSTHSPGSRSRFVGGNGPKIHKRIFSLLYSSGETVPDDDLLHLIKNDPGMRSTALRYLAHSKRNNSHFSEIISWVRDGLFIDDASVVELSSFILHSRFRRSKKFDQNVADFVNILSSLSEVQLHSAFYISLKFQDKASNLEILKNNMSRIRSSFWLSRAAASFTPKFIHTGIMWSDYTKIIRDLRNEDTETVYSYFYNLSQTTKLTLSQKSYLAAQNPTFPQSIYFPKVLQLLSVKKNRNANKIFPKMLATHPSLKSDPYFREMGFV